MNKRRTILGILLVVVLSGGAWVRWFVSSHGFSAREQPTQVEAYLARHARHIATPRGAKELKNPLRRTELGTAEARDHFADHCAICHANNGSGKTQINSGLYPPAPDLRERQTQDLTDGEIFYIIKNGICFTGTPEAVNKFPLSPRGRQRSDSGRVAARGLSCELVKSSPQRVVSQVLPLSDLGLPASRDNPCAFGASPFFKGEFLATAGSGHFFTASRGGAARMRRIGNWFCSFGICLSSRRRKLSS